jgi:hypothetical protein
MRKKVRSRNGPLAIYLTWLQADRPNHHNSNRYIACQRPSILLQGIGSDCGKRQSTGMQ